MNIASRFQFLFNIITKCIHSFSDSNVRKQLGFCQERTSACEEGQCRTGTLYQCYKEEEGKPKGGGGPQEGGGGGLQEGGRGPKLQRCPDLEEVVIQGPLPSPASFE
jgi:hypothetical protein